MCVGVEVVVGVVVVVVVTAAAAAAAAAAVSRVKDWLTHVAYHASSCDCVLPRFTMCHRLADLYSLPAPPLLFGIGRSKHSKHVTSDPGH